MGKIVFLLTLLLLSVSSAWAELDSDVFPVDAAMRIRVEFWKKVYTEISSFEAFLHDDDDLALVYEKLHYKGKTRREKKKYINERKRVFKERLLALAKKKGENLTSDESGLLSMLGNRSPEEIRKLASNIRYQQGMADRYLEGLQRSYLYLDEIKVIIKKYNLPIELAFLPHVESSFNYLAYSKVGAAGIWQFMRPTARLFGLKMNYVVDDRRDPLGATEAAAKLLLNNFQKLGAWPLAITAYNHGSASIERAVAEVKSRDLSKIISEYGGRRFGFASKNFYATFIAASEISQNPEIYFKEVEKLEPAKVSTLTLDRSLTIAQISKTVGINKKKLEELNLSLRPIVFRSNLALPRKFVLKLPLSTPEQLSEYAQKMGTAVEQVQEAVAGSTHVISRGETLDFIAKAYGVRVADIVVLNQIERPSSVFPGMKLQIPEKATKSKIQSLITQVKIEKNKIVRPAKLPAEMPKDSAKDVAAAVPATTEPAVATTQGTAPVATAPDHSWLDAIKAKVFGEGPAKTAQVVEAKPVDLSSYSLDATPLAGEEKGYSIVIESDETLGHFADWANIGASAIRKMNGLDFQDSIQLGQKLKLPVDEKKLVSFNAKRLEFHTAIEEDFFSNYKVDGETEYVAKSGDTVDGVSRKLDLPFWLLRKYQPPGQFVALVKGQKLRIPKVVALSQKNELPSVTDKEDDE